MAVLRTPRQSGFSLVELMVAMAIMLLISGAAVGALLKMTSTQATIWNRTQMHSGIRGATEVLQQEVGQAGRVALPNSVRLLNPVTANLTTAQLVTLECSAACDPLATSPVSGMFPGEKLVVDGSTTQETVTITEEPDPSTNQIKAIFTQGHVAHAAIRVLGAFATGVIPPVAAPASYANGSSGTVLKLYGDINGDGKMVYVEYTCDPPAAPATGNLYRNSMAWNAASSPAATASQILLSNITKNPDNSPCFTYQTTAVHGVYYVTDVAITLTVQTQLIDPVTKQFQTETKALLNVSPRNVFYAAQVAAMEILERIQPIPPKTANLLP
jgi:prepilin-type N-terminal cleavage/methylation domain-containing protein